MCWSSNVSLFFSLLQIAGLSIAVWRGRRCDLFAAIAHLPVLGQEVLTYFLWLDIDAYLPQVTMAGQCSATNRLLSLLVALDVNALPLFYLLWCVGMFPHHKVWRNGEWKQRRLFQTKAATVASVVWLLMVLGYFGGCYLFEWCHLCSFQGDHGHMVWAFVDSPPWFFKYPGYAIYLTLVSAGIVSYDGTPQMLAFRGAVSMGPTLIVPLWLWMGSEFGSLWCWSAGIAAVALACEQELDQFLERKGLADAGSLQVQPSSQQRVNASSSSELENGLHRN